MNENPPAASPSPLAPNGLAMAEQFLMAEFESPEGQALVGRILDRVEAMAEGVTTHLGFKMMIHFVFVHLRSDVLKLSPAVAPPVAPPLAPPA